MAGGNRDDVQLACARSGAKAGGQSRGRGSNETGCGAGEETRGREESAARRAPHGGCPPLPGAALEYRDHQVRRGLPVGRPALKLSSGVSASAPREAPSEPTPGSLSAAASPTSSVT